MKRNSSNWCKKELKNKTYKDKRMAKILKKVNQSKWN
jgi:hypothetical protein